MPQGALLARAELTTAWAATTVTVQVTVRERTATDRQGQVVLVHCVGSCWRIGPFHPLHTHGERQGAGGTRHGPGGPWPLQIAIGPTQQVLGV